jgi:type IV secretory pathway protease TraF
VFTEEERGNVETYIDKMMRIENFKRRKAIMIEKKFTLSREFIEKSIKNDETGRLSSTTTL